AQSRRTGTARLEIGDAPVLIAEGIFAAELIAPIAAAGLLADAIVLDRPVPVVFVLRLLRDLREHRKSVPILLQRGTALARQQRRDMARWKRAGLRPYGLRAAVQRLRELVRLAEAERRCRPVGAATARLRIAAVCFLREAPAGSAHRAELLCVRQPGTRRCARSRRSSARCSRTRTSRCWGTSRRSRRTSRGPWSARASSSPVRRCPHRCGCGPSSRTISGSPSPTRSRRARPAGWRR